MLLQGFLFAFVGMCAGLTGTAISNGLLLLRQKLDPNFKSQNEAPNVPLNAATWAAHMGISSNVRYQVLNGLDMVSPNIPEFVSFCKVVTFRLIFSADLHANTMVICDKHVRHVLFIPRLAFVAGCSAKHEPCGVQDLHLSGENSQQCFGRHLFCHIGKAVWSAVLKRG
jgi:hypothetical protein